MSARRVWIVGAGKRVVETALPAFLSLRGTIEVAGVFARSARDLAVAGQGFAVRPLESARPSDFATGDVLYVAVGKDAMPPVLARLATLDRARLVLLVDTPVLKVKHLRHAHLLTGWLSAGVAEDVVHLPWFEAARAAAGRVHGITFEHAAYAYHGFAQSKALAGARRVVSARRTRTANGARRTLDLDTGAQASVLEPRDYSRGRVLVEGDRALVSDRLAEGEHGLRLECLLERGRCVGFRAGDHGTRLADAEIELQGEVDPALGVIARMESLKRVAFRRLAADVAAGRVAYSIDDGLDDSAADWFLERFGSWRAGGLRDVRRPFARALWGTVGRFA